MYEIDGKVIKPIHQILFPFLLTLILMGDIHLLSANDEVYLFDDFNYSSVDVRKIDSSGSMFSRNSWQFNGKDTMLKAWFKWNSGDKEFSEKSSIEMTDSGFLLKMERGDHSNSPLQPMIISSFQLKYGTYAAMCKFSEFDKNDRITQAYWLASPLSFNFRKGNLRLQYRDEIDFEWNNWWHGDKRHQMSTGCNQRNYKNPSQLDLNAVVRFSDNQEVFFKKGRIPITGKTVLSERWALCIFVIDSIHNETRFAVYFPDDGEGNEIWAAETEEWGSYYKIHNYSVYHPQIVNFSMGAASTEVYKDAEFNIDWFFFSESTSIDYKEILAKVNQFKQKKIDRTFSGNIFFNEYEILDNKDNFYFVGDTAILPDREYKWFLQADCKRWYGHYDMSEMKYRFHNSKGYWEDWNNLFTTEPVLIAADYQDSLEINAKFSEFWSKYQDSARVMVKIRNNNQKKYEIIHNIKLFTNPMFDYSKLNYSISEDTFLDIQIFDITGRIIYNQSYFAKAGTHSLEFDDLKLSGGFYQVLIKAPEQIKAVKFFKRN